jgi:hypothetical protein
MQAFWSVKDAGGVRKWLLSNSGLWMLQFSSQLNKQYLIWKLTSSAKIWDLSKVTDAHSLASEGFKSDQGQNEKILCENPKITNFCLTEL